jgi:hypothetical protein
VEEGGHGVVKSCCVLCCNLDILFLLRLIKTSINYVQ